MEHTYYSVYEHIVFSTKHRMRVLSTEIQPELFAYLAGGVKNQGCEVLVVGGELEHVHLLVRKSNTLLTGDLVKEIKRTSSKWMKGKHITLRNFGWQSGYGAFSVSYSRIRTPGSAAVRRNPGLVIEPLPRYGDWGNVGWWLNCDCGKQLHRRNN